MLAVLRALFIVLLRCVGTTSATEWSDYSELFAQHSVEAIQAEYGPADEPLDFGISTAIWNSLAESFVCGLPSRPLTFVRDWTKSRGFADNTYKNYEGVGSNYSHFGLPTNPLTTIVPGVSQLISNAEFGWQRYYYCGEHFPEEDRATCFWRQINREKCRQKYLKETLPSDVWEEVEYSVSVSLTQGPASVLFLYIMCLDNDAEPDFCPDVCNQRSWACGETPHAADIEGCVPIGNGLFENQYLCECIPGYTYDRHVPKRERCKRVNICESVEEYPCNFGGTASCELTADSFECVCKSQWTGRTCSEPYNACVESPVQWYPPGDRACGQGTCQPRLRSQEYTCDCPEGFGDNPNSPWLDCDRALGACDLLPCNHGNCVLEGTQGTCDCDDGYEGQDCSAAVTHWSPWSTWQECEPVCGHGRQTQRQRHCVIGDRGQKCQPAPTQQTKRCANQVCPVDGEWQSWNAWSRCSVECGGGIKQRIRDCRYDTPYDRLGWGAPCEGQDFDQAWCNTRSCQ